MGCNGDCVACSGCGRELELTWKEIDLLLRLGQIPFLPVVRKGEDPAPIYPGQKSEEMSLALQCLEKKGLITLDYDQPIRGYDYPDYPIRGSFALTERGQQALELMEYQGIRD